MAELFFQTEDYSQEQLDAWVTEAVDMQAWDASFRRTRRLLRYKMVRMPDSGILDESGYLDRLYVRKDYQRQGIASAICDELERFADRKTVTTHAFITAKPFFLHRGYRVVRKQGVIRRGVVLTNFVMKKQPEKT